MSFSSKAEDIEVTISENEVEVLEEILVDTSKQNCRVKRKLDPKPESSIRMNLGDRYYSAPNIISNASCSHQSFYSVYTASRSYRSFNANPTASKDLRYWEQTSFGRHYRKEKDKGLDFIVMSYNVLAQDLLLQHPHLYQYCDPKYLDWEYRKMLILKEIKAMAPDILCLQEAQWNHFYCFFTPELEKLGYQGHYKQRPSGRCDGCCIFFKQAVFSLENLSAIEYRHPEASWLSRDNVGLIAKLRPVKKPHSSLCIANTHLLYNPKRHDIKLIQAQLLLTELDKIAYEGQSEQGEPLYCPSIVTGDFNSDLNSCVFELLTSGYVEYAGRYVKSSNRRPNRGLSIMGKELLPPHLEITDQCQYHVAAQERLARVRSTVSISHGEKEVAEIKTTSNSVNIVSGRESTGAGTSGFNDVLGSRDTEYPPLVGAFSPRRSTHVPNIPFTFNSGALSHQFRFKPVYRLRGDPVNDPVTTHQDDWVKVDYMFYSKRQGRNVDGDLKLIGRYRLPSRQECYYLGHLPTKHFPSDHLFLLARFLLKK